MSETKNAYVAGFFDGEGYINVRRVSSNRLKTGFKYWRSEIEIVNTDQRPLDFIYEYFKFGRVSIRSNDMTTHRTAYRWRVTKKIQIISFLEAIIPFLIVKKQVAIDTVNWIKANAKQIIK